MAAARVPCVCVWSVACARRQCAQCACVRFVRVAQRRNTIWNQQTIQFIKSPSNLIVIICTEMFNRFQIHPDSPQTTPRLTQSHPSHPRLTQSHPRLTFLTPDSPSLTQTHPRLPPTPVSPQHQTHPRLTQLPDARRWMDVTQNSWTRLDSAFVLLNWTWFSS